MSDVAAAVAGHRSLIIDPRIWFAPGIPLAKAQGAIRSYAGGVAVEQILLLVDNTVWGGCGDGMMITSEHIHAHDMMDDCRCIPIREVKTVSVVGSFAPELMINGTKFVTFNCIDIHEKHNHEKLGALVMDLARLSKPDAVPSQSGGVSPGMDVRECPGCGAPREGMGACIYCLRTL